MVLFAIVSVIMYIGICNNTSVCRDDDVFEIMNNSLGLKAFSRLILRGVRLEECSPGDKQRVTKASLAYRRREFESGNPVVYIVHGCMGVANF